MGNQASKLESWSRAATPFAAGAYWASITFTHATKSAGSSTFAVEIATQAVALGAALAILLLYKRFTGQTAQRALAAAASATGAAVLLLSLLGQSLNGSKALTTAYIVLYGVSSSCLLLFWGMNFASLDKKAAEQTVLKSALFCCVALGAFFALPQEIDQYLSLAIKALSPLPFLVGQTTLPIIDRSFRKESMGRMVSFFLSRAFVGICLGITGYFAFDLAANRFVTDPILIAAAGCAAIGLVLCLKRRNRESVPLLSTIPFLLTFVLLISCPQGPEPPYGPFVLVATPVLWFSWIVLSSVQISECKDEFGVNEALLSFAEKSVKNVFWFCGTLVAFVIQHLIDTDSFVSFANYFSALAIAIWLAVVLFSFVRLASTKERSKMLEALPTPSEQIEETCEAIAEDFKLSKREKEVLTLLAEGHTQAYICNYYTLSPGTVKSHVSHIYRKLKIHKREELFDLLEGYRKKNEVKRRYGR